MFTLGGARHPRPHDHRQSRVASAGDVFGDMARPFRVVIEKDVAGVVVSGNLIERRVLLPYETARGLEGQCRPQAPAIFVDP